MRKLVLGGRTRLILGFRAMSGGSLPAVRESFVVLDRVSRRVRDPSTIQSLLTRTCI